MADKVSVYGCADDPSIVKIGFKYEDGYIEWFAITSLYTNVVQNYLKEGGELYRRNDNAPSLGGKHRDNSPMLGGDRRIETSHLPKCIRCGMLYDCPGNGTVTAKCDCRAGAIYEVDPSIF